VIALRASGALRWLAAAVFVLLGTAAAGWPAVALVALAAVAAPADIEPAAPLDAASGIPAAGTVLVRSLAWAFAAAVAGALLAWPASRAFRRDRASIGNRACAALVLLPAVVPPWLTSAALWMSAGPGTVVGDFVEQRDSMPLLRSAILAASLATWSAGVAFAALVIAGPARIATDGRLLALDGASPLRRAASALARDGRALLAAVLASAVFLLGETTVFDLAQVSTFGFELRTLDALGAPPRAVLWAAAPALALTLVGVLALPALARRLGDEGLRARVAAGSAARRGSVARRGSTAPGATLVVAALPSLAVATLLVRSMLSIPRIGDFVALHGAALGSTALCAAAAALVAAAVSASLRVLLEPDRSWLRTPAAIAALALVAIGVAPATITALAAEAAYNRAGLGALYDSPAVVVLVLAARALPVAVVVAMLLAAREAPSARRLRALDGATLRAAVRGLRGELVLSASAAFAIAFAWSVSELIASGRVAPPGLRWIATDVLNAIHYQRPDTVMLAAGAFLVAGAVGLAALLALIRRLDAGRIAPICLLVAAGVLLPACGREPVGTTASSEADDREMSALRAATPRVDEPLAVQGAFAGVGRGAGQFNSPRVVACDERDGSIYAIDKDARVQRFSPAGATLAEWRLPKSDRGKPVGATVAPGGHLVVADTHEHRVVCFSPSGELLWTLGGYGRGPGEFIYPTDIAFAPDGRLFVAEYGGNDRIQVFGPDRRHLYAFGRCGTADGEFLRPQALAFDAERDELFVADAGNHRIQVFTSDGEFRRALGGLGADAGRFSYPFGLLLEIGGLPADALGEARAGLGGPASRRTLIVAEHSNHRVQRIDAGTGESLRMAGGLGREPGRLKYPWAVAAAGRSPDGSQLFAVCDQGNSRIVFFTLPFER